MASGICIFSENFNNRIDPSVAELVSAAHLIQQETGEKIQAIVVAADCDELVKQLEALDIDEIYVVKTKNACTFQDDSLSLVISEMIKKIDPTSVLIPATVVGRSLFPRVAARMGTGLTADCTELLVSKHEDGSFYIKQNKPSFGENVMVSIVTKQSCYPQMMTIRQGVYSPHVKASETKAQVHYMDDIHMMESKIEILEVLPVTSSPDSITGADVVVVAGRGVLEEDNFELLQKFASKIGAAIGATRPLSDEGLIAFENQIGQTGCTIRPQICLTFGVSGAIQHTEGIKDTKLLISVNTDKDAPIFNISDYGVVADLKDILQCALDM